MPKVLSLKKPQDVASKQKPISYFFKTAGQKGSGTTKTLSPTKKAENGTSNSKRKASSPISVVPELVNGQLIYESKSPKKLKPDGGRSPLCRKSNSPKKSPNKENINKSISPQKSVLSYFDKKNGESTSPTSVKSEVNPITVNDNIDNHVKKYLNHESSVSGPNMKPSYIQHVTHKVSPNKNGLKKVNSPQQQSPNKGPLTEFFKSSPDNKNKTPEKVINDVPSSPKRSPIVKALDFSSEDICDDFDEDFDVNDLEMQDVPSSSNHLKKASLKGSIAIKIENPTKSTDSDTRSPKGKALLGTAKETKSPKKMQHSIIPRQSPRSRKSNSPKKKTPIKENMNESKSPQKSITSYFTKNQQNIKSPTSVKDIESSPKKSSSVKALDFSSEEVCDDFGDEWVIDDMEDATEDLDLSTMQRCKILSIKDYTNRLELRLQCDDRKATCYVEGIWLDTPLVPNEIVSILASRDPSGRFCVTNTSGLLVLRPDHLVSSTSVVAGVFCKRKAVLQERWRGIDSANMAMTTGILIHELVQKALTQKITSIEVLRAMAADIIKESVDRLYDAGLSEAEARSNIQNYIPSLADFMNTYVAEKPPTVANVKIDKSNWSGHIDKVLDIEENLCCPKLGLKGKIDATVQVTIHDRKGRQRAIVPLELKSGKASMSAEHRGQLVLYGMMLNLHDGEDPAQAAQRGLLLYLKDRVELKEVSCGYPERRDLVMLRNQLVQYLAASPQDIDTDQLTDIEDASVLLQQKLPEPVDHHNACAKCPYLTLCSLHLWHTDGPNVSEQHPLAKLHTEALGHLSKEHIQYFLHWTALLKMEERGQMVKSPLHALWTESVQKREKRGACAANLKLKSVVPSGDRYMNIFQRTVDKGDNVDVKSSKGPQEGEFSIVGIEDRPWIAAGVISVANTKEIHILLERDLSRRLNKDTVYHIDTYESFATTVQNLTNLGVLMEDSDRAERLRKLIIDKEPPQFELKLHRDVGRLGTKLMRSLNIQQQRAVLKALATKDYALMRGLPGTGKTQTISVLIQMLVALKQRVLVTAHTHSAVDTVLSRLPESLRVMRLGSSARVAPALLKRSEQTLTADCNTPDQLAQLYDSMEVVGVTCLGAAHAMLARTTFDLCIVDEATQVLQCTVLRPLFAAKRFVLVGDPEQLPPVVRSKAARRLGMEESLFHRLMCEEATSTLQLQYRMNQALADLANRVAYNDRLKCADQTVATAKLDIDVKKISRLSVSPWLSTVCSPEPQHAALFLNVETPEDMTDVSSKNSCTNPVEACVVIAIVEALKQGNVKSSDIGVIAPYRDQVALLRRSLLRHSVDVSTVDQFQGKDKPVIIYSCTKRTDKQEDKKVKEGEVLNDQRRLAVSVTRAKHKFLIIGNSEALRRYEPLQRLIQTCTAVNLDKDCVNKIRDKYKSCVS
ncbi:DNA replication ATP-dependent helicase/nuclease DNA2 [Trichoplusia ni]|uniref:DNA helicase n=1 Tax=Trichoplusia ni TaxID=7111 RepID=A0A7E5WJM5_TRINI|nr:DNA replication ATP-dependent helicase/nuclease DNA2 [Trichoplusia ni]